MSFSYWRRHPNTYPHDIVYTERGTVEYVLYPDNFVSPTVDRSGLWWLDNLRALTDAYPDLLRLMNLRVQIHGILYTSRSVGGALPLTTTKTYTTEVFT